MQMAHCGCIMCHLLLLLVQRSICAKNRWAECRTDLQIVLGVFQSTPDDYFVRIQAIKIKEKGMDAAGIEKKIQERLNARKAKDFALSDAIRKELAKQGVLLKDRPDGTTDWEVE